jgi:hypothetical protein
MNRINRIIFRIMSVALLILSCGLSCKANPVGLTQSCVTDGPASCNINDDFGFVLVDADAMAPGGPGLPSNATAFAGASDTLTFFGHGNAFVEFQFNEFLFVDGGGSASVSFDNGSLINGPVFGTVESPLLAITFGTLFSFDISATASEDLFGALAGHDRLSEAGLALTDILVVNAAGKPLRGIRLTSGSGTKYPLDAANMLPSPEPPSLLLLGFGLIALLFTASRKKFKVQLQGAKFRIT